MPRFCLKCRRKDRKLVTGQGSGRFRIRRFDPPLERNLRTVQRNCQPGSAVSQSNVGARNAKGIEFSEELARRGFELLGKRDDFEKFFDALKRAGLFEPSRNPAPVAIEPAGYFQVPYWSALDYLVSFARIAGQRNDLVMADKVMNVVRSVSSWRDADGRPQDNHYTAWKFAEILGLVPTPAVSLGDLDLVPAWLASRFDRGMVGHALDEFALKRLLHSESPEDWDKALAILNHCTAIRWDDSSREGTEAPVMAVEEHWLKELVHHHSEAFGARIGGKAAELFLERVREVFSSNNRSLYSRAYRPAIEDHEQNRARRGPENISVEGLRDVTLSWCAHDPVAAKLFVEKLLGDDAEIVRRVGIYVVDERWDILRTLYATLLVPKLFDPAHVHESYNLLRHHFGDLNDNEKSMTFQAIRAIPKSTWADDSVRSLKQTQRQWLSAIANKGHPPADKWFEELRADEALGGTTEHPDFYSYIETWSGPGPTPYSVQELVAFATNRDIVETLNTFEQQDTWRGPTVRALVDALEEAVRVVPEVFLELLPEFLKAKPAFQYGVISGFKQAWEATGDKRIALDWDRAWGKLVICFEQLIGNPEFWREEVRADDNFSPSRDWIPPCIADFLQAGTRNDEHAYSADLLPRTWLLIGILLQNAQAVDEPSDDAMTQAINSSKGKATEALLSHVLRACRVSDKASGGHAGVWAEMKPIFEEELAKCKNANYEFSTLAGAYLANLVYVDREWVQGNLPLLFPREFPANAACAIDGLAYCPATRPLYAFLAESEVLDRALRSELKRQYTREKLVERIAVAYLWGDEELDSPRFSYMFDADRVNDLEDATEFFQSIRGQDLSDAQKERVLKFWERCIAWSQARSAPVATVLEPSTLSCYLTSADGRDRDLLVTVAPYVHLGHAVDSFIEDLARLVEVSPDGVSLVLGKVLDAQVPFSTTRIDSKRSSGNLRKR